MIREGANSCKTRPSVFWQMSGDGGSAVMSPSHLHERCGVERVRMMLQSPFVTVSDRSELADAADWCALPEARSPQRNRPGRIRVRDFEAPIPQDWRTENGDALPDGTLRVRLHGPENAPVVGVLGGISGGRNVADVQTSTPLSHEGVAASTMRGWWPRVARTGGGLDLSRYQILSMDYAPLNADEPLRMSVDDHARLWALAQDAARIERVHALVGASFGGCVALAFAAANAQRLERLVVISAAHRPHPMATAWRGVQRRILDFAAQCDRPEEGVALARQLAMITYRSPEEFEQRFAAGLPADGASSEVCEYLMARGAAHVSAMNAARYATLSASLDRHQVDPAAIATPTLLIGADTDRLIPMADMQALYDGLAGPKHLATLKTLFGHDGFLKEDAALTPLLGDFLDAAAPSDAWAQTAPA